MFLKNNYVLPKGTIIPKTVFIGGIDSWMAEMQLKDCFSKFGSVRETKIITDHDGVCKGYGFVSFYDDVDVDKIVESQISILGKKLRLAPAIRKQNTNPRPGINGPSHLRHASQFTQYVQPFPYTNSTQVMCPQIHPEYQMPQYYQQVPLQWPYGEQSSYMSPQPFWCHYGNEVESTNAVYTAKYDGQAQNVYCMSRSSQKKLDKSIQTIISCLYDDEEEALGKSFCSQDHFKDRRFMFRKKRPESKSSNNEDDT